VSRKAVPRRLRADVDAPPFEQFARRLRGDEGSFLVLPSSDLTYLPGSPIPAIGLRYVQRTDGLLVPASAARAPQPIDLIHTYITYSELFGWAAGPEYVIEALGNVPRDQFVTGCAELLGAYEALGSERREIDDRLATAWFKEPTANRVRHLLTNHATLVAPQALLLLMQLGLLHSPEIPDADAKPRPFPALVLALQQGLGSGPEDHETTFLGQTASPLFRQIVASHHFSQSQDEATTISHHHQRWVRLSRDLSARSDAVDLSFAFFQATGIDKDDFTAVGLAIWAHCETHGSYPIPASALDSFKLSPYVVERTLALFSGTPEELRGHIAGLEDKFHTEWSFDVLRRFPVVRLPDGSLIVLSKRLLLERIFGWLPIYDLTEGFKARDRRVEADRAELWLRSMCEADALIGLTNLASRSRFYGADQIQAAFGTAERNADAAIEYPDAWVVVEIGTHQLKRTTVVVGDPDSLESDLRFAIDAKAAQLDETIKHLIADESRLTRRPPLPRRQYVPVLALTEGFPVNPMTTFAVRERLLAAELFTDPRIAPLHILDQEELDMAEAMSEEGGPSLLQLLDDHQRSTLAASAFKDWLILDRGRGTGPRRPRRLEAVRQEAWEPALQRLKEAQNANDVST